METLKIGEIQNIGNYQVRNFNGYKQSREGKSGDWKFHISGFDSTSSGESGFCSVITACGGRERVPIDEHDRITILGKKYGRKNWYH